MLFYIITKAILLLNYPFRVPENIQVLKKIVWHTWKKIWNEKALSSKWWWQLLSLRGHERKQEGESGKIQIHEDKHHLSHSFAWNKPKYDLPKAVLCHPFCSSNLGKIPFLTIIYSVSNWLWKVENVSLVEHILFYF